MQKYLRSSWTLACALTISACNDRGDANPSGESEPSTPGTETDVGTEADTDDDPDTDPDPSESFFEGTLFHYEEIKSLDTTEDCTVEATLSGPAFTGPCPDCNFAFELTISDVSETGTLCDGSALLSEMLLAHVDYFDPDGDLKSSTSPELEDVLLLGVSTGGDAHWTPIYWRGHESATLEWEGDSHFTLDDKHDNSWTEYGYPYDERCPPGDDGDDEPTPGGTDTGSSASDAGLQSDVIIDATMDCGLDGRPIVDVYETVGSRAGPVTVVLEAPGDGTDIRIFDGDCIHTTGSTSEDCPTATECLKATAEAIVEELVIVVYQDCSDPSVSSVPYSIYVDSAAHDCPDEPCTDLTLTSLRLDDEPAHVDLGTSEEHTQTKISGGNR
jgi:hypothetical protein